MRKLIASGLGALTLASGLAFATATPAGAVAVVPTICDSLPAQTAAASAAVSVAGANVSASSTALGTATSLMNTAFSDYAQAVADWLNAIDGGTGISDAKSIMDTKLSDLATKIAAWSAAKVALFNAQNVLDGANAALALINAFNNDLCA